MFNYQVDCREELKKSRSNLDINESQVFQLYFTSFKDTTLSRFNYEEVKES